MDFDDLQQNNLIDVLDTEKQKWREARVVKIDRDVLHKIQKVKIHFKGLSKKFDEIILRDAF